MVRTGGRAFHTKRHGPARALIVGVIAWSRSPSCWPCPPPSSRRKHVSQSIGFSLRRTKCRSVIGRILYRPGTKFSGVPAYYPLFERRRCSFRPSRWRRRCWEWRARCGDRFAGAQALFGGHHLSAFAALHAADINGLRRGSPKLQVIDGKRCSRKGNSISTTRSGLGCTPRFMSPT